MGAAAKKGPLRHHRGEMSGAKSELVWVKTAEGRWTQKRREPEPITKADVEAIDAAFFADLKSSPETVRALSAVFGFDVLERLGRK